MDKFIVIFSFESDEIHFVLAFHGYTRIIHFLSTHSHKNVLFLHMFGKVHAFLADKKLLRLVRGHCFISS